MGAGGGGAAAVSPRAPPLDPPLLQAQGKGTQVYTTGLNATVQKRQGYFAERRTQNAERRMTLKFSD